MQGPPVGPADPAGQETGWEGPWVAWDAETGLGAEDPCPGDLILGEWLA